MRVVAVAERYLIITHVKKKKNQRSSHSIKKEEISLYLVYSIINLGKMTGKAESFQEDRLNMNFQTNI